MTILVVGHSGQVARAIAERAGLDYETVSLGRPDLDLTDKASISAALETTRPSIVINAAAYTAVDKAESDEEAAFAVNETGPAMLARACKAKGLPLIHYSTDYVFDGAKSDPYNENDPTSPLGVYGRSKLAGEQAIAQETDDFVILRTAWVYSPFGGNFVKTMLRLAGERDALNIVADQWGCPTSAIDIADATLAISNRFAAGEGLRGVYHLAAPDSTNWHGFAEAIFSVSEELGGPSAKASPISASDYPTPAARPANSRLDGTKLERDYGLRLPSWRDSMRQCVTRLLKEGTSR